MAKILRGLTKDGSAMILVINSTDIVEKAKEYHYTSNTATAALGRVLTAASLMGTTLKEPDDSLTLTFKGDGVGGKILAVSDYKGNVRGLVENPSADPERRTDGKLNVAAFVGRGEINVIKDTGEAIPYNGITEIVSGEIAEDIAAYYANSEQVPTLCALGVLVNPDSSVKAAGGVMVQLLPFAAEETVSKIEENAKNLSSVSSLFASGATNEEIANIALEGIEYEIFDEYEVSYVCTCSHERFGLALLSLNPYELWNMLVTDKKIEVNCHFCCKKYTFTGDDIEKYRLLKEKMASEKKD